MAHLLDRDDEGTPVVRQESHEETRPKSESITLNAGKKRRRVEEMKAVNQKERGVKGHGVKQSVVSGRLVKQTHSLERSTEHKRKPTEIQYQEVHGSLKTKKDKLLDFRQKLPIWPKSDYIKSQLKSKDVLILVGETGSGKSTQVPQFLLNESWCKGGVAITQPRRVAAISLARRVAEEMGSPLGSASPVSKVGYSVRFDKSVSPNTKVLYLTEGMLLQEMLRDPALKAFSTVIIDEVHERSVNVDLLLGFLRNLVTNTLSMRKGNPLKVIVMSATADVAALVDFFEAGFAGESSLNTDIIAKSSFQTDEMSSTKVNTEHLTSSRVGVCHIEGRLFPVKVTYLPDPTPDFVEAALKCIFQIHYKEPLPGDILVFLTGQDTVELLERLVNEYADSLRPEVPKVGPRLFLTTQVLTMDRFSRCHFLLLYLKMLNKKFFSPHHTRRAKSYYPRISPKLL